MTLRELVWAAEAVQHDRWNHTAHVMCLLANLHRDPRRHPRPYRMVDFHPYLAALRKPVRPDVDGRNWSTFKSLFKRSAEHGPQ